MSTSERSSSAEASSLRARVTRGGTYLLLRELAGILIRFGGVAATTRLVGPSNYGQYYGALTAVMFVAVVAQMGADSWLVRMAEEPAGSTLDEVFTTLVVVSSLATAAALIVSIPMGAVLPSSELDIFRVLCISVPINVLWAPAQGRLERRFDFRSMARLEVVGDLVLYGVAVPLAAVGLGPYALVIGYLSWQTYLLFASAMMAEFRPRWRWNGELARSLLRFGFGFSSAQWARRLGYVSGSVLVGAFTGYSGVGYLGLAMRLVDSAGFAHRAAERLGVATFARVGDSRERLRKALEEGMILQVMAVGAPIVAVALLSHQVIPLIFGSRWLPAADLFCVLAIGGLLYSQVTLQFYLLMAKNRVGVVAIANMVATTALWAIAAPLTYAFGAIGYCCASSAASLCGWLVVDREARKFTSFSYRDSGLWALGFSAAALVQAFPGPWRWLLLAPLALTVADRRSRAAALEARRSLAAAVLRRRDRSGELADSCEEG